MLQNSLEALSNGPSGIHKLCETVQNLMAEVVSEQFLLKEFLFAISLKVILFFSS